MPKGRRPHKLYNIILYQLVIYFIENFQTGRATNGSGNDPNIGTDMSGNQDYVPKLRQTGKNYVVDLKRLYFLKRV